MNNKLSPRKRKITNVVTFYIIFHIIWIVIWVVNMYLNILPSNVHNPIISLISPYLAIFLLPSFDSYDMSQWWGDVELMRPAIIFWLLIFFGTLGVYNRTGK